MSQSPARVGRIRYRIDKGKTRVVAFVVVALVGFVAGGLVGAVFTLAF